MSEYKRINVDICENGYIITANKRTLVFDSIKKVREWIEDNIAPTGDIKEFSDALGDSEGSGSEEAVSYITLKGQNV